MSSLGSLLERAELVELVLPCPSPLIPRCIHPESKPALETPRRALEMGEAESAFGTSVLSACCAWC